MVMCQHTNARNTHEEQKMLKAEDIRRHLKDCNVQAVSRATGVSANAIYRFMKDDANPLYDTVEKLSEYVEKRMYK